MCVVLHGEERERRATCEEMCVVWLLFYQEEKEEEEKDGQGYHKQAKKDSESRSRRD